MRPGEETRGRGAAILRPVTTTHDPVRVMPERIRALRRAEYDRLVAAGVFHGERVELLAGRLVTMSPIGSRHAETVDRIAERLFAGIRGRGRVRVQSPFAAGDESEPEPDLLIAPPGNYADQHPALALLIVEVADSSLAEDLELKARIYEGSAVEEYWVVDLVHERVLVHRRVERGWGAPLAHVRGETLAPQALPDLSLEVDAIIP